jgi:glycosyltransferase involved in cell wall biosynthesis
MKTKIFRAPNDRLIPYKELLKLPYSYVPRNAHANREQASITETSKVLPEILFITSYPSRECGIATYSHDLVNSIKEKFGKSFSLKICALEGKEIKHMYSDEVKYILQTSELERYDELAKKINSDKNLSLVFVQHEFGLYEGEYGEHLLRLLAMITKPIITTFHTVLPVPEMSRKKVVRIIASLSESIVVMTNNAANILEKDYEVSRKKIKVIPHGTHLVSSFDREKMKKKNQLENRLVLSTFGLLSSGKSIETALDALSSVAEKFPNVIYLIIGKTHPGIVKHEGEKYRDFLHKKVAELNLQNNVRFINKYLSLNELLEYLQLTDIYLFTSKDPHQAVSGTFAYAMSCGCPVISTPIPHAKEFLNTGAGVTFDFQNSQQLAGATIKLLSDPELMQEMRLNALHKICPTAWQNAAIAHAELLQEHTSISLKYEMPEISLSHIKRLTTRAGMIQFAAISNPDIESGYTLDDNARALIAITKHFRLTGDTADLVLIDTYLNFIVFCQQPDGKFFNYVDGKGHSSDKNREENLEDSNGRAIWALGEFISQGNLFHTYFTGRAKLALDRALKNINTMHSPRAMAFAIKGLYHYNRTKNDPALKQIITSLADNLVSKYRGVSDKKWKWFEEYLTYANSVLPESLLCAWLSTGNELFKDVARSSFNFLLSIIFEDEKIKVVSNQGWRMKGKVPNKFGEQPIDVAYTILALSRFYDIFKDKEYLDKMETSFNWFLGKNHLHQIIYNPCTGGCYDGLEESHVNLNQGAESTVSYLLSRLTAEKYFRKQQKVKVFAGSQMINMN